MRHCAEILYLNRDTGLGCLETRAVPWVSHSLGKGQLWAAAASSPALSRGGVVSSGGGYVSSGLLFPIPQSKQAGLGWCWWPLCLGQQSLEAEGGWY